MDFDKVILGHLSLGMVVAFILGVACLVSFMWYKNVDFEKGYSTKRFLRPTLPNIVFHIVSSVLVLFVLHEISEVLIEKFFSEFKPGQTYHLTMAGLTGMFGSVLVGYLLEKWAKRRNVSDKTIKHVHNENCDH